MNKVLIAVLFSLTFTACGDNYDVVNTESGLSYVDVKVGEGREVKNGDLVLMHFTIWRLGDSTDIYADWQNDTTKNEFKVGSSFESDQQMRYVVGSEQFVKGSDEGFIGMKAGGKRTLVIPASLAYGDQGFGPIPPNTSIKILMEIFEVKDPIVAQMWDVDSTLFKQTESGLQYAIIEEGTGPAVEKGKLASVHYSGFLMDGTKFDSSVERDEPLMLMVGMGQVIPGWDEGLQLLKQGAKARFIIPPQLAYGERDLGVIPPNSTLIFDVEVVEVKDHGSN